MKYRRPSLAYIAFSYEQSVCLTNNQIEALVWGRHLLASEWLRKHNCEGAIGGREGVEKMIDDIQNEVATLDQYDVAERATFYHNVFVANRGIPRSLQLNFPIDYIHQIFHLRHDRQATVQEIVTIRNQVLAYREGNELTNG